MSTDLADTQIKYVKDRVDKMSRAQRHIFHSMLTGGVAGMAFYKNSIEATELIYNALKESEKWK